MKVYKFGGASVRNADAVRNLGDIVARQPHRPLVVVVSAMGKTTNALEKLVNNSLERGSVDTASMQEVVDFHLSIAEQLMGAVPTEMIGAIQDLQKAAANLEGSVERYYDQVVSHGELLSTKIIYGWLRQFHEVRWLDARELVMTDGQYQRANILWDETGEKIREAVNGSRIYITQGFIGGTEEGTPTTLGREGSDFSAAVFAHCLRAQEVTVWKDVPGIMNADPKLFPQAIKIDELSYEEVTEMAYFGAKVIHPKTLRPLAGAGIPLHVRSFVYPEEPGSAITNQRMSEDTPCFLFRDKQVLATLRSRGSALLSESLITELLETLRSLSLSTNLFQHSALTFSFCFDSRPGSIDALQRYCEDKFDFLYNEELHLATVKHATPEALRQLPAAKTKYLEQSSRNTYQVLYRPL